MIELKDVCKSFGQQTVIENFSMKISPAGRIALMGRSGAGKTTLTRLIMGLEKPDSGTVSVKKGLRFGAVFQEDRLISSLSAASNCQLAAKNSDRREILELLEDLGISKELAEKRSDTLSGGEKRRAAVARAILSKPDVFILDEPFKGIDQATLPDIYAAINAASAGKALILVTHSEDEAKALGCEVIRV